VGKATNVPLEGGRRSYRLTYSNGRLPGCENENCSTVAGRGGDVMALRVPDWGKKNKKKKRKKKKKQKRNQNKRSYVAKEGSFSTKKKYRRNEEREHGGV